MLIVGKKKINGNRRCYMKLIGFVGMNGTTFCAQTHQTWAWTQQKPDISLNKILGLGINVGESIMVYRTI